MKQTEKSLLKRNEIAASLGQELVIDMLKKYRERFVSQMKAAVPTANDPYGINIHRYLGRIEAIDYLIAQGEDAIKPQNNN